MNWNLSAGGPLLWAILALSCVAWGAIAWSWLALRDDSRHAAAWRSAMRDRAARGDRSGVLEDCRAAPFQGGTALVWALSAGAGSGGRPKSQVHALLESERMSAARHLPLIATLGSVALLLGLLGTIMGMVTTFDAIASTHAHRAEGLARGISEALLTTQAGLIAALPIMLVQRLLRARIDRESEQAAHHVRRVLTALGAPFAAEGDSHV